MAHNIDIGIFFIAKTQVDIDEAKKWLEYLGANEYDPNFDFKTDSEALIELCGRRCYNAFQPGLNPNVQKIRKDIASYIEKRTWKCTRTCYIFICYRGNK